jgi:hypothetical protein
MHAISKSKLEIQNHTFKIFLLRRHQTLPD